MRVRELIAGTVAALLLAVASLAAMGCTNDLRLGPADASLDSTVQPDAHSSTDSRADIASDGARDDHTVDDVGTDVGTDGPLDGSSQDAGDGGSDADASPAPRLRYYPGFWLTTISHVEIDANLRAPALDRVYRWIRDDAQLKQAVRGMVGREDWSDYEPSAPDGWQPGEPVPTELDKHHFDWTRMDRILAWHENRGLRYWAMLEEKTFNNNDYHAAPAWAQADFEYTRPIDSDGKCPKAGNIVPIWQARARDAWAVFVRAFVERYGDDERLGLISFSESDSYCSKLPNFTRQGYADGQMHMMTVARQASPVLNVVKMVNWGLWEQIANHGRTLSPPVGLSAPDVLPFRGYPNEALYGTTHAHARKHADQVPAFWQVQYYDLHWNSCAKAAAWQTLSECTTDGNDPCKAMDVTCYLVNHMRVDGIAFSSYEDRRDQILAAIRAYRTALPASAFQP